MSKRKVTAEELNASAWAAALACSEVDEVPAGWITAADLAVTLGKSTATVGNQLSRAVRESKAEMQKFRIQTARGPYPVPHYRLK
jgi:hypothetical protein